MDRASGEAELPAVVHLAFYRIAQEALNKVVKHAGASNAWLALELGEGTARLEVGDDGCGFARASSIPNGPVACLAGLRTLRPPQLRPVAARAPAGA